MVVIARVCWVEIGNTVESIVARDCCWFPSSSSREFVVAAVRAPVEAADAAAPTITCPDRPWHGLVPVNW